MAFFLLKAGLRHGHDAAGLHGEGAREARARREGRAVDGRAGRQQDLEILQNFGTKILAGSFSAVSKRNFARKYAFDSIFQALQDVHTFAPLRSQNFNKKMV